MAIQLIDNFLLNAEKPIDNRFVVGPGNFYTERNDIPLDRRYPGLRVWDLDDENPYLWDGTDWINEDPSSSLSGSGTVNRIAKFTPNGSSIGDSQIFDNGTNVGIGTITPGQKLTVNGSVFATGFIGNGSQLTNLNINSINVTGKIGFNNLPNGTVGHILQSTGSSSQWVAQSSLNVGSATTATTATTTENVNVISNSNNSTQYVLFTDSTGSNKQVRTNVSNSIRINPSNGNVSINGNISIGSTTPAPTNGLRVQGESEFLNRLKITRSGGDVANNPPFSIARNITAQNANDWNFWVRVFNNESRFFIRNPDSDTRLSLSAGDNTSSISVTSNTLFIHSRVTGGSGPDGGKIEFGGNNVGPTGNKIIMYNEGETVVEGSWGLDIAGNGNLRVGGEAYKSGANWITPSDKRIKRDILDFTDGLSKILKMKPVSFKYNEKTRYNNGKEYIGFIAQDLEDITPYMVTTVNSNGLEDCRILDESALTKILVNAIKEQQEIIEDLKKRVEDLES